MKKSELEVYEFCALCAPSCQTLRASPVSRTSFIRFNAVVPFLLAFKRNGAFEREELLVYNSVRFVVLSKKVSVIIVPKGRHKAEILNELYSYIVGADKICKGEKSVRVRH